MASTIGTSRLIHISQARTKFSSLRGVREIIGLELERALGRNPGIWLWIRQICSHTGVFIQNSLILRRRPAFFLTAVRFTLSTWCLQASLSTTRRRVMSLVIRAMFRSIHPTLAKWLASVTIRLDGLAPAARFSKVVSDLRTDFSTQSQSVNLGWVIAQRSHPYAHSSPEARFRRKVERRPYWPLLSRRRRRYGRT